MFFEAFFGDEVRLFYRLQKKSISQKNTKEDRREFSHITKHGTVIRDGDVIRVLIKTDMSHLLDSHPEVTCLNPGAPKADRVYQKVFYNRGVLREGNRGIYLPDEYDLAIQNHLHGRYVLCLAMNGYSSIKPEQCQTWGVQQGAYEIACRNILKTVWRYLRKQFPDLDIRLLHGSSNMGVDRAIIEAAQELRRPMLGFSCPEYAFYVTDENNFPMYIASSVEEYSDAFVRSGNILIAANGRLQAYRMDIRAVFEHDKVFIPINVLRLISTLGGPPAKSPKGYIEDAVAHFENRVYMVGQRRPNVPGNVIHDPWKAALHELGEVLVDQCRHLLDPEVGLEVTL